MSIFYLDIIDMEKTLSFALVEIYTANHIELSAPAIWWPPKSRIVDECINNIIKQKYICSMHLICNCNYPNIAVITSLCFPFPL